MRLTRITDYVLNWKTILFSCITVLYSYMCYRTAMFDIENNPWILGDWLINYQDGGFKRRGLSGSLFFLLQDITHLRLQYLVAFLHVSLYVFFLFNVFRLVKSKALSPYFFTIFLTPLTFTFLMGDIGAVGRKELMLFALFSYFIVLLDKNELTKSKEALIIFLLAISTLFHEVVFFYVPFFIGTLYVFNKKIEPRRYAMYFLASFIPILLIQLFGCEINMGKSLQLLHDRGVDFPNGKYGIFAWEITDVQLCFSRNLTAYTFLYPIAFLIGIAHLFLVFVLNKQRINIKKQMSVFFICLSWSLPIYILAVDWGRWLHIQFTLFLLMLLLLQSKEQYLNSKIILRPSAITALIIVGVMNVWRMYEDTLGIGLWDWYKVPLNTNKLWQLV